MSNLTECDPTVLSYRKKYAAECLSWAQIRKGEVEASMKTLDSCLLRQEEFRASVPTTWRGVLLKGYQANFDLAATSDYSLHGIVKEFFRHNRRPISASWMEEFRHLIVRVERNKVETQKALQCLNSIERGIKKFKIV
jgi:hypothetical protein